MTENSRILLLGCGYVGSVFAQNLARAGHRVTAVVHTQESAAHLTTFPLDCRVADVTTPEGARAAVHGKWNAIVFTLSSRGGDYRKTYVEGMHHVLDAVKSSPPSQILYTSSTSVYAQTSGEWVTENDPAEPPHEKGRLLVEAENTLRASGIPSTILRLTGIYGPTRHALLDQLRTGASVLPGNDSVWINQIHRDDAAAALHFLLEQPPHKGARVFNVTDNEPVLRKDFVTWLCEKLKREPPRFDPEMKSSHRGRDSQPSRRISNAALRQLGWTPRYANFREGYQALL